jgi:predicted transposase YbfD/YdcC
MAGWNDWGHLRTVLRVESESNYADGKRTVEERYYISSLRAGRLSPEQWLRVIRTRWAVENQNHWVWDSIFEEDDRPWIQAPKGMLAVMVLRRVAYNMLALFRGVTQRSEERRQIRWRDLIHEVRLALYTATLVHIASLRTRSSRAH